MKILSLFLLFFLPLSLFADDSAWFAGIDGGVTGTKLSSSEIKSDYEFGPEYGFRIGLQDKNSRMYLGYTRADDIDGNVSSTNNIYLGLDGISDEFHVIAKSTAKFFFGIRLGSSTADIDEKSKTAFLGGLQTGFIFLLPADFEIEFAYRHYLTLRKKEINFNAGTIYGALNYKFYTF